MQFGQADENSPLQRPIRHESRFSSSIIQICETYGKPFFLVLIAISSIIPILQVYFGMHYEEQCPINEHIPTYMIVAGTSGLLLAAFCAFIVGTFLFITSKSISITRTLNFAIFIVLLLILILVLFIFIWFIFGCVWIFNAHRYIQFADPFKSNYCQPQLYKASFSLLVITFVWTGIQCCLICFRQCCVGQSES